MRPRLTHAAGTAVAVFLGAIVARAYDQEISSTLWAEGYSVPAADGGWVRRRRLVEELRLGAWNLIPGSGDPYYEGPRFSIHVTLRVDTDFAVAGSESDPDEASSYVPGLMPMQMDALLAYAEVQGLWQGALDLRAGRQIRTGTLGFFAFDGAESALHLPPGATLYTYMGYEVRGGDLLGYDDLELDGTDSGGRHDMEADRYPYRTDPERRLAAGVELGVAPFSWFDCGVAFETVGLSMPLASQDLGGRLALGGEPVLADGRVIWSAMLDVVSEAEAELAVTPVTPLTVSAYYNLFRPTFEGDSIFNVFDIAPENDVGGRVEVRPLAALSVAAWGFTRLSDGTAGLDGESADATVSGAGGGGGATYRALSRSASLRVSGVREWGEDRVGVELGGRQDFLDSRLEIGLRVSYWHIEDAFSPRFSGDLAGYVVSGRFRIADGALVAGEFEHYLSPGEDQRFVALALLQLELWR